MHTYSIPSIARVLAGTGELNNLTTSSKRYADTVAIGLEFITQPRDSLRSRQALARMNWLHRRYQRAGKIANSDMIFVLAGFIVEPIRWIERYEWRALSELELCALGTFFKATGDDMGIDFSPVGETKDGLEFAKAIQIWTERYEAEHMVPQEINHALAEARLNDITQNMPRWKARLARQVFLSLMMPRLRTAVMLPPPEEGYARLFARFFAARRFCLRYLMLPRWQREKNVSPKATNGRYHLVSSCSLHHDLMIDLEKEVQISLPWYVKPTFSKRWGLEAWITWLEGGKIPGDDGAAYKPSGYVISEVGPEKLEGQGREEMDEDIGKMGRRGQGCPF